MNHDEKDISEQERFVDQVVLFTWIRSSGVCITMGIVIKFSVFTFFYTRLATGDLEHVCSTPYFDV
jgi:hypothetical protein